MSLRVRPEYAILVGGVVLLFAAVLFFAPRKRGLGRDPQHKRQGSSHYTTPTGGKAYYRLLREMGLAVRRHERKAELLPPDTKVFAILAPSKAIPDSEVEWLRGWVEKGGTIFWCPRRAAGAKETESLLRSFGLRCVEGHEGSATVSAVLDDAPAYSLRVRGEFRLRGPARSLAKDSDGHIVAEVTKGRGRFVAIADPLLVGNAGLAQEENAAFLTHLALRSARGGAIAFDEYHHGFTEGEDAFEVMWDTPLSKTMLCFVLAAVCGVFAGGRRLGPPIDLHEERRRRPAEFVEAFANLCRKLKAGPQAFTMIVSEFRLYLQRRCGSADPAAAERLAVRAGLPPGTIAQVLERARRLASGRTRDATALVGCARELESIRAALEKGRAPVSRRPE